MSSKLLVLLIVAVSCCWSVKGLVVCPRLAAYSPCICAENGGNPGTIFLLCSNRNLTDSTASHILDAFLTSPNVSPISIIELSSNPEMTRVPDQIRHFPLLTGINLDFNNISAIETETFNFTDVTLQFLNLANIQLKSIAPGAFQGKFVFSFKSEMK